MGKFAEKSRTRPFFKSYVSSMVAVENRYLPEEKNDLRLRGIRSIIGRDYFCGDIARVLP